MFRFVSETILSKILLLVAVSIEDGGLFDLVARRNPANTPGALFTMCEMDKIAWQKPFSSASDFAIKKSKKIHIFLI